MQTYSAFFLLLVVVISFASIVNGKICQNPSHWKGKVVCDFEGGYCGQCVSFVKVCSDDRRITGEWKKGRQIKGGKFAFGTAIATFPNGKYDGHAAIYITQDSKGIHVWDQWVDKPVGTSIIPWDGKFPYRGDDFHVID